MDTKNILKPHEGDILVVKFSDGCSVLCGQERYVYVAIVDQDRVGVVLLKRRNKWFLRRSKCVQDTILGKDIVYTGKCYGSEFEIIRGDCYEISVDALRDQSCIGSVSRNKENEIYYAFQKGKVLI